MPPVELLVRRRRGTEWVYRQLFTHYFHIILHLDNCNSECATFEADYKSWPMAGYGILSRPGRIEKHI